jgi:outer membrane murein-binding lipoprotein Lpp
MRNVRRNVALLAALAGILLASTTQILAQTSSSSASSPQTQSDRSQDANIQNLTAIVQQLQSQVQKLSMQLDDVRQEEQQAREEAQELRKELDDAKSKLASLTGAPAAPAGSSAAGAAVASSPAPIPTVAAGAPAQEPALPGYSSARTADDPPQQIPAQTSQQSSQVAAPQNSDDQLARLQEDQQLTAAEVKEQSQTKVESGSKYRLRLSGIVLLNLFSNRGAEDNIDFPEIAEPPYPNGTNSTFGGSLRQSQITLQAFGPTIAGAHTSANIGFDFAGAIPETPNGAVTGLVRLRTGSIRFDWANTSIIAGQDALFIAPLAPTSFATLAVPPLSYAGNLWSWVPQVRVEHRFNFSNSSKILVQAGILDPLSGDVPYEQYARDPTFGEQSGLPAFAARVAWSHPTAFDRSVTLGFSGYYSREDWGDRRYVDAWATIVDLTVPLTRRLDLTTQFYRGAAVGGLGGGIGQSVLWNGSLLTPSTEVEGLDSVGGWTQLKFRVTTKIQLNAALGDDNPFAPELREYSGNTGYYGTLLSRNFSPFFNVIYQPRSDAIFSLEYQRLKTYTLDSNSDASNHISLNMGYIF